MSKTNSERLQALRNAAKHAQHEATGDPEEIRQEGLDVFEALRPAREAANETMTDRESVRVCKYCRCEIVQLRDTRWRSIHGKSVYCAGSDHRKKFHEPLAEPAEPVTFDVSERLGEGVRFSEERCPKCGCLLVTSGYCSLTSCDYFKPSVPQMGAAFSDICGKDYWSCGDNLRCSLPKGHEGTCKHIYQEPGLNKQSSLPSPSDRERREEVAEQMREAYWASHADSADRARWLRVADWHLETVAQLQIQKEWGVAEHLRESVNDGCMCEPCKAAREVLLK